MGSIRTRRRSSTSKVVVDKDNTDKFARNSPTLSHLYRYPVLANGVDRVVNLPVVNTVLSWILLFATRTKCAILSSPRTPRFVKVGYNTFSGAWMKLDELFAVLVLREGLGAFLQQWKLHNGSPGLWLVYFCVDYWANVLNLLLKQFVVRSHKLGAAPELAGPEAVENDENKSLRHLDELRNTTIGISKDLQEKVQTDYIDKTTGYAKSKYDELFKPVADKIHVDYVAPTRNHAMETYKTVSSTYESNLSKSESIPRAILSTGVDLKNITLENLKSGAATELQSDENAKGETVPVSVEHKDE